MKDNFTANVELSSLALKLRNLRLQKGYDYKRLSLDCGISVSKLVAFEYDKAIPTDLEYSCIMEQLK